MVRQEVPVFLITGFLESGKTNFLLDTIGEDYFAIDGKTLLFITEEGIEEFDDDMLTINRTIPVIVEDQEELTPAFMEQKREETGALRVIIEWNGMWNPFDLALPEGWFIHQQLMMVNAETFDTYYKNGDMRSILARLAQNAEVIICNRCDQGTMNLQAMKRELQGMNPNAEIVMEDENGEVDLPMLDEDLPFDVSGSLVEVKPEHYGVWFLDANESTARYEGKKVRYTAMVYKQRGLRRNEFILGRMAMNGCTDPSCVDPTCNEVLLGYLCKFKNAYALKNMQWVTVTASIKKEFVSAYGEDGPVLYVDSVEDAEPIPGYVTFG